METTKDYRAMKLEDLREQARGAIKKRDMSALGRKFTDTLQKKYPKLFIADIEPNHDLPNSLHVGLVEVDDERDRGKGLYKAFHMDLKKMADDHNVILTLYPTDHFGSNKERLVALNKAMGFTGPDEDGIMTRHPATPLQEAAYFSKQNPVKTGGRIVPRRLMGIVYHGSSIDRLDDWFDTLDVHDEAAAVWVTPEEEVAKRFAKQHSSSGVVFVNRYKLNGLKAAELDNRAYDRVSSREDFDRDGRDMRYALADYLSGKGYEAWLTSGSISMNTYEDIAIFSGSESEAEYNGTSFMLKDGSWTPYQYFYDVDEVIESMRGRVPES